MRAARKEWLSPIGPNRPLTGGAFWPPLAVVIAGGVGLSVLLSLLFTPAVYALLYGLRRRARDEGRPSAEMAPAAP